MKTQTKSPYEIRLDLLQLATEILMAKHTADSAKKNSHMNKNDLMVCTSPTTEEIIIEAEKLNLFVSKPNM